MMKLYILPFISILMFGFVSCNKFLDVVPDNRTEIDDLEKVKSLLTSAYPGRFYGAFLEPRVDGIIDHGITTNGPMSTLFNFTHTAFMWEEYSSSATADGPENYWSACYGAVSVANHALEAIEKLGESQELLPYKGEALLCRAYAHFMLLTLFTDFFDEKNREINPGIPYVTKPEEVTHGQYNRGTVASTLRSVKADLAEGMKHVGGATLYSEPKFHFTIDAAYMLALRIALYEKDYNRVIEYATRFLPAINGDYKNLYTGSPDTPVDELEKLYNRDGSPVNIPNDESSAYITAGSKLYNWSKATSEATSSQAVGLSFSRAENANIILASVPYSTAFRVSFSNGYVQYTHGDFEFKSIVEGNASGTEWELPLFSFGSNGTLKSPSFIPKLYEEFQSSGINSPSGTTYTRVSLFRLEEAILARAEAYAMLNRYDEALADLTMYALNKTDKNEIIDFFYSRDKVVDYYSANTTNDNHYINNSYNIGRFTISNDEYEGKLQRALILSVLDAKRVEYIYEGMRWFDILRWNIPVTHVNAFGKKSTLMPDDDRRVLQLPETVTLSGIELNPYSNIPNPWI